MSYRDWKVGDKVVCVNDGYVPQRWKTIGGLDGLTTGKVYTIRRIGPQYGHVTVSLEEIVRPIRGVKTDGSPLTEEIGYNPSRFRPVQPRKTDISVFTALLHTNKQKEPA